MEDNLTEIIHVVAADCGFDGFIKALMMSWLHHLILVAKTTSTSGENPNWKQAMNSPFADKYWDAACVEVNTLEKMKA